MNHKGSYTIVTAKNTDSLAEKVNQGILNGWEPLGGLNISGLTHFSQAMVRDKRRKIQTQEDPTEPWVWTLSLIEQEKIIADLTRVVVLNKEQWLAALALMEQTLKLRVVEKGE